MVGRNEMPLTLILLDEVQQFIREDSNISLTIQTIAEELCSKFRGRVFLVATGQSALGDVRYLEKLLTRFVLPVPLGSADINSVIRKTVLLKKDTAKPEVEQMLDLRSGEIDKHLQGSSLKHSAADRQYDVADWPILATRRRFWERVLAELDRSGLGATLRGQLRISLDAVKRYGERPLGVAVPGDFLFDTFAAEALSRNLILREVSDLIALLRAQPRRRPIEGAAFDPGLPDRPHRRRCADPWRLRQARDPRRPLDRGSRRRRIGAGQGARLACGIAKRGRRHRDQRRMAPANQGKRRVAVRLQPAPRRRPPATPASSPRQRSALLQLAIDDALAARRSHPARNLEDAAADRAGCRGRQAERRRPGAALVERLGSPADDDAQRHQGRRCRPRTRRCISSSPSIAAKICATRSSRGRPQRRRLQGQGVPTTDAGKEAKAAMESRLRREEDTAKAILRAAVEKAQVLVSRRRGGRRRPRPQRRGAGGGNPGLGPPLSGFCRGRPRRLGPGGDAGAQARPGRDERSRVMRATRKTNRCAERSCGALRPAKRGSELRDNVRGPALRLAARGGRRGDAGAGQRRPGQGDRRGREAGRGRRSDRDPARHLHIRRPRRG